MKVEYRVRPVTRYVVTRYHEDEHGSGVETKGEYDNEQVAYDVGYALAAHEHQQLSYPVGDERVKYPEMPNSSVISITEADLVRACAQWETLHRAGGCITTEAATALSVDELASQSAATLWGYLTEGA